MHRLAVDALDGLGGLRADKGRGAERGALRRRGGGARRRTPLGTGPRAAAPTRAPQPPRAARAERGRAEKPRRPRPLPMRPVPASGGQSGPIGTAPLAPYRVTDLIGSGRPIGRRRGN